MWGRPAQGRHLRTRLDCHLGLFLFYRMPIGRVSLRPGERFFEDGLEEVGGEYADVLDLFGQRLAVPHQRLHSLYDGRLLGEGREGDQFFKNVFTGDARNLSLFGTLQRVILRLEILENELITNDDWTHSHELPANCDAIIDQKIQFPDAGSFNSNEKVAFPGAHLRLLSPPRVSGVSKRRQSETLTSPAQAHFAQLPLGRDW
jgi:hypothetical protein